jgi:4-oxalocrotonate tautomerase
VPIAYLHILEGRSPEVKEELVKSLTQSICECLKTNPEQVRILINEVPKGNWAVGGTLKE